MNYFFFALLALICFYLWLLMKWPESMLPIHLKDLLFNVPLIWKAITYKKTAKDDTIANFHRRRGRNY